LKKYYLLRNCEAYFPPFFFRKKGMSFLDNYLENKYLINPDLPYHWAIDTPPVEENC